MKIINPKYPDEDSYKDMLGDNFPRYTIQGERLMRKFIEKQDERRNYDSNKDTWNW